MNIITQQPFAFQPAQVPSIPGTTQHVVTINQSLPVHPPRVKQGPSMPASNQHVAMSNEPLPTPPPSVVQQPIATTETDPSTATQSPNTSHNQDDMDVATDDTSS